MSDIDRIFIAVNVELVDLVVNENRALCRYEFFEIIVRIAQAKLVDAGYCATIDEAVVILIEKFILRHRFEKMEG